MAQLFDARAIVTLAGASAAVVITTSVIQDIADPPPQLLKIVALVLAQVIAFVAAALVRPRRALVFFLAFFNGLLIYSTATGLNTMDNAVRGGKQKQAALVPAIDSVAWWPPAEMADLQVAAGATSQTITETAPVLGRGTAVLKDPRLPVRDQATSLQRQLAGIPDQRRALQERLNALAKEAERPVHPAEREAVERQRAKNRDDLQRELMRLDELERNAKQRLEGIARLEAALGEVQRLTAPIAESAEDATRKLARASEELKAAVTAANRVTGLHK